MKKPSRKSRKSPPAPAVDEDDILPEYDFSKGRRNKYAARYAEGTNLVLLDPDVAAVFPSATEVNEALRALARIIERRGRGKRASKKRTA